jgi:prophage tail gpP-like protein
LDGPQRDDTGAHQTGGVMANEAAGSCVIAVGGKNFDHFVSFSLKRSKEETACSGQVVMSWPGAETFNAKNPPAQEMVDGADGKIFLDGQLAATIILDTRISRGSPTNFELTLEYRGRTSILVDAMPKHDTGQENKKKVPAILRDLMKGYQPQLEDRTSDGGKEVTRFIVAEGESVDRAGRRVARDQGYNYYENEQGNLVLEDANTAKGSGMTFQLGRNFTQWSVRRDISPRNREYGLDAHAVPTDDNYGKPAEGVFGEDRRKLNQDKTFRGLVDGDHDKESIKKRTKMEQKRRSAQGLNVTLKLSTWSDDGGKLWAVGKKHQVVIPVDQLNEQLEVIQVEFELTPNSRSATVTLVSDQTFDEAEPQVDSDPLLSDPAGKATQTPIKPGANAPAPPAP